MVSPTWESVREMEWVSLINVPRIHFASTTQHAKKRLGYNDTSSIENDVVWYQNIIKKTGRIASSQYTMVSFKQLF